MFCFNCGREIKDGAAFCPYCGANQSVVAAASSIQAVQVQTAEGMPKKKSKLPILVGVIAAVLVIAGTAGFLLYRSMSSEQDYEEYEQASSEPRKSKKAKADTADHESPGFDAEPESSEEQIPQGSDEDDATVYQQARMQIVSTDVSRYPIITIYLRVEDMNTGQTVKSLESLSFRVRESVRGGEYLFREVQAASMLEGEHGLNINLVADKSSSIYEDDMNKIKQVMSQFVNSLHYEDGDKAEILAFDSIVQQMCYYTSDKALLVNGIDNMSPDGMTAFYDAVHDGIRHATLQGGARCVIAFTDGIDNVSGYNSSEVIDYANSNQVPVYIIGVGYDVEESTLRNLAESTGGRYWFIDDLYDLEMIYSEIYKEQKELYAVEYISDSSLDAFLTRNVEIDVAGNGYKAEMQDSFTPVHSLGQKDHASRYELVKEALTWEEATERCQEMGGHLATITSQDEMNTLIRMAEAEGMKYIWLGGYTSYDFNGNVFGHWVTGESFSYQAWSNGEPSRVDLDGTPEWYIMLWNIPSLGGWTWNDQRNDPISVAPGMAKEMGFICEYE